ncbi:ABC transporter substrate-binding protein [Paracoccus alkanivorans]|uniref:ABC transporter substrate-binding protein n=1 Tax=Paracoccus alkanivorans TaxID=2116655 RepID=A0A3M0N2F9_9RHOB|nr:ABC transporter substrate-binding protein [Paracoccus alkanivorans]RMC37927.1 ABC transporter substrate-binding protein [Paracoccus alkanivorans]
MTQVFRNLLSASGIAIGLAGAAHAEDVTMRFLSTHGSIAAHELAQELGYFEGTGISVESIGYSGSGPESLFALASGNVDIGSAATPAFLNSVASGNDFVAAYPSNGINDDVQSIFYVLEDSPIRSIEDIAGKTIAVNTLGAHLDHTVREALRSVGLPQDSANLVVAPGPQLEQVLRSKQVDIAAFGYWQTTFEGVARAKGGLRAVFDDTDVLGDIAGGFIVLRRDWVDEHPEAARVFVEQSARALDYAREHPEETRQIMARQLEERGENPEVAQYFAGYGVREGGLPVEHDVQFWIDVLVREGVLADGQLSPSDILLVTGERKKTDEDSGA